MALCTSQKATEQRLEAMKWYFGKRHCRSITFVDDTSGDQSGKYFDLNVIDYDYSEKKYYVLLTDGSASDPAPAGKTKIEVSFTQDDDAATIAAAFQTALASILVRTELVGAALEVQNAFVGPITEEVNTNASGLTFEVGAIGSGGYIGQTGESELTTTVELLPLTDDAQGSVAQSEMIIGYGAEITIPLREMTTERWKELVGKVAGNNVTIDAKDIVGYGTKKLFQSMFDYSGRLVGHPVRNEMTNIDEDIVMLKTAPKLESINFSGASVQEASFLFSAYKDANAVEEINLLARGDHSKF